MNRKRLINLMTTFICISAFLNAQLGVLANVSSYCEPANKLTITNDMPQKLTQDDDGGGFDAGGFDGGDFDSGGFDAGGADEGPAMDPGGGDDGPPDMGPAGDDGPPDMGGVGDDGASGFEPPPGDMNPDAPDLAGPDQPDTPDDKAIDDAMKDLDKDTGTANADDKAIDDAMKDLDKDTAKADDKAIDDAMKDLDKDLNNIDKSISDQTIFDKSTTFTDTTNFINSFDRFGSVFTPGYIYGALPWISFGASLVFSAITPAILATRFGPTARVVNSVPVTPQLAKQYGPQSKVVVVEYHDNYKPDVRVVEMKDKTGKLRGYQAIALQGDKYKVLKRYSTNAKVRKNYDTSKQLASFDVIDSTFVIDKK